MKIFDGDCSNRARVVRSWLGSHRSRFRQFHSQQYLQLLAAKWGRTEAGAVSSSQPLPWSSKGWEAGRGLNRWTETDDLRKKQKKLETIRSGNSWTIIGSGWHLLSTTNSVGQPPTNKVFEKMCLLSDFQISDKETAKTQLCIKQQYSNHHLFLSSYVWLSTFRNQELKQEKRWSRKWTSPPPRLHRKVHRLLYSLTNTYSRGMSCLSWFVCQRFPKSPKLLARFYENVDDNWRT